MKRLLIPAALSVMTSAAFSTGINNPQLVLTDLTGEQPVGNDHEPLAETRPDTGPDLSGAIYRTAINTCITWHRRNKRFGSESVIKLDDMKSDVADTSDTASAMEDYRQLYHLINMLGPIDKALVTLWLDEKPYDEIAAIMGLSAGNVAVKMHRIKEKLTKLARQEA